MSCAYVHIVLARAFLTRLENTIVYGVSMRVCVCVRACGQLRKCRSKSISCNLTSPVAVVFLHCNLIATSANLGEYMRSGSTSVWQRRVIHTPVVVATGGDFCLKKTPSELRLHNNSDRARERESVEWGNAHIYDVLWRWWGAVECSCARVRGLTN